VLTYVGRRVLAVVPVLFGVTLAVFSMLFLVPGDPVKIMLAEFVTTITDFRQPKRTPYDIAVALPPSADPAPYAKAGATWWPAEFPPETVSLDQVRGVLRDGPIEP